MSKGKPVGCCETCGSEIVEMYNNGFFGQGECDACELLRYDSQRDLLHALDALLEATIDAGRAVGMEPTEDEIEAEKLAKAALGKAYRKARPTK
jgi:hypothetical protein